MWLLSCENRFSTKLQFGFFLNLVRCLLRRNLSRRNVWSRAGPSTHFNFRRIGKKQWISITFHVFMLFSLPQKMFTRLPQDTNDLLFFYDYDAMLQKCAHHLAPPTSVVTVSDQSIYNKMKQLATVRKWNFVNFFPYVALVCTNFMKTSS